MRYAKIPDYINPKEMVTGYVVFNDEKCTRCGNCAIVCVGRSIEISPKVKGEKRGLPRLLDIAPGLSACINCGNCVAACPNDAITIKKITLYGEYYYRFLQYRRVTYPKKY